MVGVVHNRVEHAYQNHCDVMVAAETQKKEEIERLLVAQKSIVISSRDRIVELERTGNRIHCLMIYEVVVLPGFLPIIAIL